MAGGRPRIVIAPDSFKESASAVCVARAMARGVRRALPQAEILEIPLADGGEGTAGVLAAATGGRVLTCTVTGPLGEPVAARYGVLGDGATAVIEMAEAAGLHLVAPPRRDPRLTTTRGVGELVDNALARGLRRVIIGLGGSATNDAGAGLARALGYRLLDSTGRDLPEGGAALARLARIDASARHPALAGCEILAACDVTNPLCGPHGAARVFGPQKGASPEAVEELDGALAHFAEVVRRDLDADILELPGAGAAGGLGGGLVAFTGARLKPGFEIIAEACDLERRLAGADLILTGEGRLDAQTAQGKVPVGVARLGQRLGIPVVALAGALGEGYQALYPQGITAAFSLCNGPLALDEAIARAEPLLAEAAEAAVRLCAAAREG
jgi:glycerate kinase